MGQGAPPPPAPEDSKVLSVWAGQAASRGPFYDHRANSSAVKAERRGREKGLPHHSSLSDLALLT